MEEEKLFGPDQLYVAPATVGVERIRVLPSHIGVLLFADTLIGGLTVTT